MPLHIQPALRAREEALEMAGLILTLDSATVTCQKSAEVAGTVAKVIPSLTIYVGGGKPVTYAAK